MLMHTENVTEGKKLGNETVGSVTIRIPCITHSSQSTLLLNRTHV